MDREPWFAPKRIGYGAGAPSHRNGWIVLGAYVAGMAASGFLFTVLLPFWLGLMEPKAFGTGWTMPSAALATAMAAWLLLAVAPLTAWFVILTRRRTRGGWRMRTGDEAE